MTAAFEEHQNGKLANSGAYDGLSPDVAIVRMTAYATEHGFGRQETTYRLKDWGDFAAEVLGHADSSVVNCEKDGDC